MLERREEKTPQTSFSFLDFRSYPFHCKSCIKNVTFFLLHVFAMYVMSIVVTWILPEVYFYSYVFYLKHVVFQK